MKDTDFEHKMLEFTAHLDDENDAGEQDLDEYDEEHIHEQNHI